MSRIQELNILVCQACESIYKKAYDCNLEGKEYNYYINSILSNISIGLQKSASEELKSKEA